VKDEPDTKWNVQTKFLNSQSIPSKSSPTKTEGSNRLSEEKSTLELNMLSNSKSSIGKPPLGPGAWFGWLGAAVLSLISFTPMALKRGLATALTWLYVQKMGANSGHIQTVKINLRACFPDMGDSEKQQLLENYFFTLMLSVFQMPLLWWRSEQAVIDSTQPIGLQPVIDAQEKGEACVFLITHTACLDVGLVTLSPDFDMTGFYKPFKNPVLDWLVRRSRSRFGGKPISRGDGFREIVRRMNDQAILCYLCDEDYGLEASVFAPLFGHEKATLKMLPKITKLTKAKVFPMATYLNTSTGNYELHIQPALENYPSGDEVKDAAFINAAIERSIRKNPAQYLWKLKIFRSCPNGKDSRYAQVKRGELQAENI